MALKLVKKEKIETSAAIEKILTNLNSRQQEAVQYIDGPLLIVAGAGSGKTRVLTHRIAYLLSIGVQPERILALTFTNKAADEMKGRIGLLVDKFQAERVWAGTFHSIFARILRIEANQLGYTSSFSIYDTDDSVRVIKQIIEKANLSNQKITPQLIQSKISWAKNQMITWQKYAASAQTPFDKHIANVFAEYEKRLRLNNAMDFDDLLLNMIALLKSSEEIKSKYCKRFDYILIDEYQDTNRAQYEVLKILSSMHRNICVVGDDAQSIYRWRGAEIRNILDFNKDYPDAKLIRLEQNYRSTKIILEAADSLIAYNKNQIPKKLWTDNAEGEKIELIICNDEVEEAHKICKQIKRLIDSGTKLSDIAVFYRTNAQSLPFENAFRKENIPYIVIGGMSFYKRKEIKDTVAYLRILINPKDNASLLRIINEPPRGLGNVSIRHYLDYSENYELSLLEALGQADEVPNLTHNAKEIGKNLYKMFKKYSELIQNSFTIDSILEYLEATGILNMYREINTDEALDRLENIEQFVNDIARFIEANPENGLNDYLQQITLVSDIDNADFSSGKLSLMTLHSAKGLEFPIVFISGIEEGLLPFSRANQNHDEEEEERRLFYVGITRAQKKLFLSYARERMRFGSYSMQNPSRFLSEIKRDLIDLDEYLKIPSEPTSKRDSINSYSQIPTTDYYSQLPTSELTFRVGDIVKHSHFGKGKITGLAGEGDNRRAVVYFPSVGGKKHLMLKYANLQKVPPERNNNYG